MSKGGERGTRASTTLAALITVAVLAVGSAGSAAAIGITFTVDTTDGMTDGVCGGGSDCSLGDAITAANANAGKDTIAFDIPGAGPHVIVIPSQPLFPQITDAVVVDGLSQGGPGYAGPPLVEVDLTQSFFGLRVIGPATAGSELRGLAVYAAQSPVTRAAIEFFNSGQNVVERNFVGTNASGTVVMGSGGISMQPLGIGTTTSGNIVADNLVAAGGHSGVEFSHAAGSQIVRNKIGTDPSGTRALPKPLALSEAGVVVSGSGNLIARNVIANWITGINIDASSVERSSGNRIEGNMIGTDITGTIDLGNRTGIQTDGHATIIGGPDPAARNVISGNGAGVGISGNPIGNPPGVFLGGSDSVVQGNYIGTDVHGVADLGNDSIGVGSSSDRVVIADNLVSGNDGIGVAAGASGRVRGNLIGTDVTGMTAIPNGDGLLVEANSTDVIIGGESEAERNIISGNTDDGILGGALGSGFQVLNNYIGTNRTGEQPLGNGGDGIELFSHRSTIGRPGAGNVISANGGQGVHLRGVDDVVQANRIGTDVTGKVDLGNSGHGVLGSGFNSRIGGPAEGEGNLISGNGGWGIELFSPGTNLVESNRIGTDGDGSERLANDAGGIRVRGNQASFDIVRNLVSGNGGDGVHVFPLHALASTRVRVIGNLIGTDASGEAELGNAGNGVRIGLLVDWRGSDTVVGGPDAGDRNTIAFNGAHGVSIRGTRGSPVEGNRIFSNGGDGVSVASGSGPGTIENTITANSIFANAGLGIDLEDNGVTPNDAGDGDGGANLRQNFPVNLQVSPDRRTVTGTLNSRPNTTYRVELFRNVVCDPSGHGEGERFFQATEVVTDGSGNRSFTVQLQTALPGGDFVTATATDVTGSLPGNTSEFSPCTQPPLRGTIVVRKATEPAGDPTEFEFVGDAPGRIGDGQTIVRDDLAPGTYTATEVVASGWDLKSIECDDSDSGGDGATATFRVAPGETVTCTFTNVKRGRIVVEKQTLPDGDPATFSFSCDAAMAIGDGQRLSREVRPGEHTCTEAVRDGWDLRSISCDDADSGGDSATATFRVAPGETVTCTFTNVKRGAIVVEKRTLPAGSPQTFEFTPTYGAAFSLRDGESSASPRLVPGSYGVAETLPPGWRQESAMCSDGSPVTGVDVAPGETVTCTFVNVALATLIVKKETRPARSTAIFDFSAGGGLAPDAFTLTDGGTHTFAGVAPRSGYSVAESVPDGWTLTAACSDGSPPANIDLAPGETVTCTFTNAVVFPDIGLFVIGDGNSGVGTPVTFWSAQWSKLNAVSGGPGPAAFKGFAERPSAPGCGTVWSTDPGNSPPPPHGPLPTHFGVLVSSSIEQSGSTISGDTVGIVIVRTNPGYSPNPGHEGTGTVVARVC